MRNYLGGEVLVKSMKQGRFHSRVAVTLTAMVIPFLGGCSVFAPGMQMNTMRLTPSVNAHDQIVKPTLIPITAELIQHQVDAATKAHVFAVKHYKKPAGFSANTRYYRYRVGAQDILQITVWNQASDSGTSGLTQAVTGSASTNLTTAGQQVGQTGGVNKGFIVDSSGDIFYPYLGNILVAGKTTGQIRRLLTKRLSKYVENPQVTVRVLQYNSQKISVTGAVHKPMSLPITSAPLNVLSAVMMAGGPIRCGIVTSLTVETVCADLHSVEVRRHGKSHTVDLNKLTTINGSSENWLLKDGDIVYVPNNNQSRIFVLGQVNAPGAYNMIDGAMTLREAVGDAKGMSQGSNPAYTYVIRNYRHDPRLFVLNLRSPDALNLAGDFNLKPGDIVFVSTSALHDFNAVLNQFTPTLLTAVSIKSLTNWK